MDSESVGPIYLDPPFNSDRSYSTPIGSEATKAAFVYNSQDSTARAVHSPLHRVERTILRDIITTVIENMPEQFADYPILGAIAAAAVAVVIACVCDLARDGIRKLRSIDTSR